MQQNPGKLHELCRLRSSLEAFAAERLRESPERAAVMASMRTLLEKMQGAARAGNHAMFHDADFTFHRVLVDACGLESLSQCWALVMKELDGFLRQVKREFWPHLMALYREHVLLLQALESEHPHVPVQALHQHLEAGWYRIASAEGGVGSGADSVDRACAFIATHFASRFSMDDVAAQTSFVSTGHMNRLFREKLGISPYSLVKQTRLERGAELLLQNRDTDIARVAQQVGYKNASHFIKDFRACYGVTPRGYRAAGGEKPGTAD